MSIPISLDEFTKLVRDTVPYLRNGDAIVVIEVRDAVLSWMNLSYTNFSGFQVLSAIQLSGGDWDAAVLLQDKEAMQTYFRSIRPSMPPYIAGIYLFGELAQLDNVDICFATLCQNDGSVNCYPEYGLPFNELNQAQRNYKTPYDLYAMVTNLFSNDEEYELRVKYHPRVFEAGTSFPAAQTRLGGFEIVAPQAEKPFLLIFKAVEKGEDPQTAAGEYRVFLVTSQQKNLRVRVVFSIPLGNWTIQFADENTKFEDRSPEYQDLDILMPPQIDAYREGNVLIVVEAALGVTRSYNPSSLSSRDLASATSFEAVYTLCEQIIRELHVRARSGNMNKVQLLFFGDYEPAPEGYQSNPLHPTYPLAFLWKNFENSNLEDYKSDFMEKQSASVDWQKAVELAMAKLVNEVRWGRGKRLVIWIAQSQPHYPPHRPKAKQYPGFPPPGGEDVDLLLQASHEEGIEHIVIYVGKDVPAPYQNASKEFWSSVSSNRSTFIEANLASADEHSLDAIISKLKSALNGRLGSTIQIDDSSDERLAYFWALEASDFNKSNSVSFG